MIRCLSLLAVLLATGPASAICFDPSFYDSTPTPPSSFSKPDVPFCLSSYAYTKEHTCSQWELDSYFDDVADYVDDLQRFYAEAVAFANEAVRFSNEAYDYAQCEANDVNTQHE